MLPQTLTPLPPAITSHIELLLTFYTDMSQRTLEALQRLSELNMQLMRDLMEEAGTSSQRFMASKDSAQLASSATSLFNPGAEALRNYQRHLAEILSSTNASLAQTAATHMPAVGRSASAMAEEFVHSASEAAERATKNMPHPAAPGSDLRH